MNTQSIYFALPVISYDAHLAIVAVHDSGIGVSVLVHSNTPQEVLRNPLKDPIGAFTGILELFRDRS